MSLSVREVAAERPSSAPTTTPPGVAEPPGGDGVGGRFGGLLKAVRRRIPDRLRRAGPDLAVYGAYLMLAVWACGRLWKNPYSRISGHLPTDHIQFYWWLTHSAYSLVHLENPFFSHQENVPDGINMMANTSVLGIGIPLTPVTLLFGPQVSYDVYLTLALAGSAATFYYVLSRYLVKSRLAAFVGAGLFGFAPGIVHHASGQPNFVTNFLLPLIVLRVVKLREPGRVIRNGAILALLVCWQLFINEELLMLTAVACLIMVVCYTVMRPADAKAAARPFILSGLIAVGVALPLLAYPIWFQFKGPQSYLGIPPVFHEWGEDITAYFTFARDTMAGNPAVEQTIGVTEQNSWFGAPLMVLLAIIVVLMWRRSEAARITIIVGAFFGIMALGPHLRFDGKVHPSVPMPWQVFGNLPIIRYMVPSRMVYVVIACVAILLALACEQLAKLEVPGSPVPFRYLWAIAVAVALLPIVPKPMPGVTTPNIPAFITKGSWKPYVDNEHSLVTIPLPSNTQGLKAQLWQAVAMQEFKMPRGYFLGPDPDKNDIGRFGAGTSLTNDLLVRIVDTGQYAKITDWDRAVALGELRLWRAAIVVLDPTEPKQRPLWQAVTDLTGVRPAYVDDVWVWDVRPLVDGAGQ
jgi:hypothetical protein